MCCGCWRYVLFVRWWFALLISTHACFACGEICADRETTDHSTQPRDHITPPQGLRLALLKAWAALVELYHSDLWTRLHKVISPSSSSPSKNNANTPPPSQAPTGGGFFMGGGGGGGCAMRRPNAGEGDDGVPSLLFADVGGDGGEKGGFELGD